MSDPIDVDTKIDELRADNERWLANGDVDSYQYRVQNALLAFAERHQVLPSMATTSLWGFGDVQILFEDPEGGWWTSLAGLEEPTGISHDRLRELFDENAAEYDHYNADVVKYVDEEGMGCSIRVVSHDFAMKAFALHSPWQQEFYENTKELMAHALEHSGIFAPRDDGFTALVRLTSTEGESVSMHLPVVEFGEGDMPMVRSPFDGDDDRLVPVTYMSDEYELHRSGDAMKSVLGPRVDEETAKAMAVRGPTLG